MNMRMTYAHIVRLALYMVLLVLLCLTGLIVSGHTVKNIRHPEPTVSASR